MLNKKTPKKPPKKQQETNVELIEYCHLHNLIVPQKYVLGYTIKTISYVSYVRVYHLWIGCSWTNTDLFYFDFVFMHNVFLVIGTGLT